MRGGGGGALPAKRPFAAPYKHTQTNYFNCNLYALKLRWLGDWKLEVEAARRGFGKTWRVLIKKADYKILKVLRVLKEELNCI